MKLDDYPHILRARIEALESVIVKLDEELFMSEGIGVLPFLGSLPEAEIARRVLEEDLRRHVERDKEKSVKS